MLKRYGYLFMMIAIALILTACGGKESKEDVINSIEEKIDEVEGYATDVEISIKAFDDSDTVVEESNGILKINMHEKTLESSGEMTQDGEVVKYYSTEEATYAQENDGDWEDMTAQEEHFKQADTTYGSVAQVIVDLKDEEDVEMEEKDGKFIFSFKGKNEKVYKALEKPYSLTLAGAETKDVEHDLTIKVDSETYYIEELSNNMALEIEGDQVEIVIHHTYDKINAIESIEIPQEVIDEVEAADVSNDTSNQDEGKEENKDENKEEGKNAAANATGEEETRTFTSEQGGITIKMVYYYKGDTVTKQTTENVIPYEAIGAETKEDAQALFDPESEKMQGIEGVTQEMTYNDTEAIETLEVNYVNLDFEQAQNMPGMELSGNFENGISMEQSAQLLLGQGFQEE